MNDSRHCRSCGDTFEACACPSAVMTIADADAANTEIATLHAKLAAVETERDTLRAALEKIAYTVTQIDVAEIARRALDGAR